MTAAVDEQADYGTTLRWPATTPDGIARAAALSILAAQSRTATSVVTYHAGGSLLIVVDDEARAEGLLQMLPVTAIADDLFTGIDLTQGPRQRTADQANTDYGQLSEHRPVLKLAKLKIYRYRFQGSSETCAFVI